jgi:putative transposase
MPRRARLVLPGVAAHVVQRGNNRGPCFFRESDCLAYLRFLGEFAGPCGCAVHAYCLMTNHVHLFLTPQDALGCARLMKNVGQLYSQYVNRTHGRTGTLWEGRFRSCIVADERYSLACYRYIELNPVRAGMVVRPADYRWSSYCANAGLRADSLVVPHSAYAALADEPVRRAARYAELTAGGIDQKAIDAIRHATRNARLLGQTPPQRGRPRKMGSVPIFGLNKGHG